MSQPSQTPAWGTPAISGASVVSPSAAETQVMPPLGQQTRPAGPTRAEVELRSTALYYATRTVGEQATLSPDDKLATVLRVAKGLETYLLTGNA